MIETIITSSVLITVVIAVRFFTRGKISRRLQYALWGLVLLRLLMPFPLLGSPFSIMNWAEVEESPVITYIVTDSSMLPDLAPAEPGPDATEADYAAARAEYEREMAKARAAAGTPLTVFGALSVVWLLGSIAAGLWVFYTNLSFYKRLRRDRKVYDAADCALPVYFTEQIASPCLFGFLRPAVYLTPKAVISEDSTRYVLAHELCHYRHADHIWSILRGVCLAVYWFNPLVWAAAILSRADSELACDEAVIRQIGEENRISYGHTLVSMIAVRKAPSGLMNAATTMASGKRGIKTRLNMIIKNPKTVIPALAAVLAVIAVCAACTFTGADKAVQEQDEPGKPEVNMVFSSDNSDLIQIGRDAAVFYYSQFMGSNVPQYWHITKYETLSCKLEAGGENEFAVWLTSYIETDGAGFLVGQGIPYTDDINKGGICPEVGSEFRIKALGGGEYEIVSIGTGGGAQGLAPAEDSVEVRFVSYELARLENGELIAHVPQMSGDNARLAEEVIVNHLSKSAAGPGIDIKTLEECIMLRVVHSDGTMTDYYAYLLDGKAVMQSGLDGFYSYIKDESYAKLVKLADDMATVGGVDGPANIIGNIDRTDLDACVSEAILTENADLNHSGDFACEAHTVLRTVGSEDRVTVYLMALYMEFDYADGGFSQTGGSHMPVAATFEKDDGGEYKLTEYWAPQDGSYYGPSIKAKFPSDIGMDTLDTQKYITAHMQSCYAQAIEYGRINTDAVLARLVETICASPARMSDPKAYIDEHPIQYREMIYYGSHTLRYCFNLFEQGGQTGLEGHIMASACRDILGGEDISVMADTGQGWYDAFKAHAENLRRQNGDEYMAKNMPGSWLLLQILDAVQE